jgi:hypothetical protein
MADVSASPVTMSPGGPPETVLDPEPAEARGALADALGAPPQTRRDALAAVAARWPTFLEAWAYLGEYARDDVEAYAYYRVAYHRGLDRLRASGWRGSGYVRWAHESNRGFLRGLVGLGRIAARIGESAEARRCQEFARQLDPNLDPMRPLPSSP